MPWKVERRTNFSYDAANDKLLLSCRADSGTEIGIVPCINLALTVDEGCIGVHFHDFLEQEAVWSDVGGAGQDRWQVEHVADGGVAEHIVAEVVSAEVAD